MIYNDGGAAAGSDIFFDDINNRVGIGTTSPRYHLHINGTTVSYLTFTNPNSGVTASDGLQVGMEVNNDAYFLLRENANMFFRTNNLDRMVLSNNGNLGIGTTTPLAKVHANGGGLLSTQNSVNAHFRAHPTLQGVEVGTGQNFPMWFVTNGIQRIRITNTGNVGIGTTAPTDLLSVNGTASKPGGGSWSVFSDHRLKTIAGTFNRGLQEVLQLQPVQYRYNKSNPLNIPHKDEHIGFTAQEVQKVIPEAVSENSKGYLMVDNDPILWAMLNAIKEQQSTIAELTQELQAERKEKTALRFELNLLKSKVAAFDALKTRMASVEAILKRMEVRAAKADSQEKSVSSRAVVVAEARE